MSKETVELIEDKIPPHLLGETNENQWKTDVSNGDIGMEELERLVKKIHRQFDVDLKRLAE